MNSNLLAEIKQILSRKEVRGGKIPIPNYLFIQQYGRDILEEMPQITTLFGQTQWYTKEVERKNNLLSIYEENLFDNNNSVPSFNKDDYLLPEYREGGYFTSQDYYDKCDEFHKILEEHGEDFTSLSRDEYIFLKKEFFQNTYGITWLSEEEQFLPGANIIVHAERL